MTTIRRHVEPYRLMLNRDGSLTELPNLQGLWTEEQYLIITDSTNTLVEFTDGDIEVLPMPTDLHQRLLLYVYGLFRSFVQPRGGVVMVASLRLQIHEGKYREPDILLLLNASDPRRQNRFWLGADLVVEIVSPDDPERDTVDKIADYAEGNIPEYWIVNPLDDTITVLTLADNAYIEYGVFARGTQATSVLLDGFAVDVDAVFDAE
jgi:Uma2 family endonuclease